MKRTRVILTFKAHFEHENGEHDFAKLDPTVQSRQKKEMSTAEKLVEATDKICHELSKEAGVKFEADGFAEVTPEVVPRLYRALQRAGVVGPVISVVVTNSTRLSEGQRCILAAISTGCCYDLRRREFASLLPSQVPGLLISLKTAGLVPN